MEEQKKDWGKLAAEFEQLANRGGYEPAKVIVEQEPGGFVVRPKHGSTLYNIEDIGIFAMAHLLGVYMSSYIGEKGHYIEAHFH